MANFQSYEAKPVVRQAFKITTPVTKCANMESTYLCDGIRFKAYEEPQQGDYVVRLTIDDTYHCSRAVFHERNIVPEGE